MITPDRLNEIMAASEEALASFNSALCDKIAARLQATFKRDGEASLNPSSVNDIHKMMVAGMLAEDIQKEIAKRIPFLDEEVEKAFKNSAKEIGASLNDASVKLANANGVKASVNADLTTHEQKLLEADYRLTKGTMHNLTRTTVTAGQEAFIKACDDAMFQVQRGVSLDKAITDAIKKMAQAGITTVDYKSGRKDRVEVALARAIRTGINKANADLTLQRCAELGVSYVRVSQHVGARVTNNDDYTNHSWWQGQVYKVDWSKPEFAQYSPNIPEKDKQNWGWLGKLREKTRDLYLESTYKDFVEVCGFGNMLGICGINCRHTFSPFFVGINENTDKQIDEAENEKRYKETQTQRAYERNIRAIKREISALEHLSIHSEEALQELGELKKELAFMRKKYAEYVQDHNLPKAGWRDVEPNSIKGIDSIERALSVRNGNIYNILTYGTKDIPKDVIEFVDKNLHKMFKEFPTLDGKIDQIVFEELDGDIAKACINKETLRTTLKLNIDAFASIQRLNELISTPLESLSKKETLLDYLRHEFVHFREYQIAIEKNTHNGIIDINGSVYDIGQSKYATEILKDAISYCGYQYTNDTIRTISKYAIYSNSEAIAEAYSYCESDKRLCEVIKKYILKKWGVVR